jgi:PAS domain S-box-containing protein
MAGGPPRKTSAHAQIEADARLAAIVASSDDAIVAKTLEGIITSWNPAAERMFGFTAAEAVGRAITIIIPPERFPEEADVLARVRRGERVEHFETVRRTKAGRAIDISLSVSPIRNAAGEIVGASKIARDISDRKRAEAEREMLLAREHAARNEAEKANRIKDEFLATLSHELRTPLNAMLGWVRMLRMGRTDQVSTDRALETIERNTRLLNQLVEDVLDVARITTGAMRLEAHPVELVPIIEAAVESMRPAARAKDIRISLSLDPTVPPLSGDPARLQQIAWNLVSNAIKFTDRGGRVEVHLTQTETHAQIRVVDTGKGIASNFLPHVFDRFTQADSSTTRAHGGLGLGLAIARHLAELHGGRVWATSEGEGRGATFVAELPVPMVTGFAASLTATREARPAHVPNLKGVRVLIIDDDADTRDLVTAVLNDNDAAVLTAASVGDGLASLDREWPNVVLCDISLPDRDGYEFLREATRRTGDRVPIAAITAHARPEERERALAAGFRAHIAKPVDPLDLLREVARLAARS